MSVLLGPKSNINIIKEIGQGVTHILTYKSRFRLWSMRILLKMKNARCLSMNILSLLHKIFDLMGSDILVHESLTTKR